MKQKSGTYLISGPVNIKVNWLMNCDVVLLIDDFCFKFANMNLKYEVRNRNFDKPVAWGLNAWR